MGAKDMELLTDTVMELKLPPKELRVFMLNQDFEIAKAFIAVMRKRHGVEIMD
jgi:hypothetical protein